MSDFLERWNPNELLQKKSWVMTLLGNKRMGKSYAASWFCHYLAIHKKFDLVISFCGSSAANPELFEIFTQYHDNRFMFDTFNCKFLRKLLEQQENLKSQNRTRNVLLIIDDVEIAPEDFSFLGFISTRHRHHSISLMCLSVRFSYVHKSIRCATDFLLLFNTPTYSDRTMLLKEHSENPRLASFCMKQLEKYQCLVLQSGFKQKIYVFRVEGSPSNFSLPATYPENIQNTTVPTPCDTKTQEEPLLELNEEIPQSNSSPNNVLSV
jgi:hypothetical protein